MIQQDYDDDFARCPAHRDIHMHFSNMRIPTKLNRVIYFMSDNNNKTIRNIIKVARFWRTSIN